MTQPISIDRDDPEALPRAIHAAIERHTSSLMRSLMVQGVPEATIIAATLKGATGAYCALNASVAQASGMALHDGKKTMAALIRQVWPQIVAALVTARSKEG